MKKQVFFIITGLLLVISNLYAANGDMLVNGKLGIGTTNVYLGSLTTLGVVGTYSSNYVALTPSLANGEKSSYTFYSTFENYPADHGTRRTADIIAGYNGGVWGSEYLSFNVGGATDSGYVTSEKMRITSVGNIGIGTASPAAALHVNKEDTPGVQIGTAASVGTLWLGAYSTGGNGTGFASLQSGWGPLALNRNGNNVGIGTTIPGYTLTVAGSTWCSYGYWSGSDAKLKKNVLPISDALSMVLKLGGVSYEWKDDYYDVQESPEGSKVPKKKNPEGRHYGVIAQEIEKVLPEVVKEDVNGTKAVAYNEIIPVLIEAIKEQQKQIDQQKKDIEQLKNSLSAKQ